MKVSVLLLDKTGLCHRICHFILINSFKGARGRQIWLHPCFARADLCIDCRQVHGKGLSIWHLQKLHQEGRLLSRSMYYQHHLFCTFPRRGVLDASPAFSLATCWWERSLWGFQINLPLSMYCMFPKSTLKSCLGNPWCLVCEIRHFI